jgi:hypothetical protein
MPGPLPAFSNQYQLRYMTEATKKLRGLSPQANYTERPPLVAKVSANFLRIEVCRVVSSTDLLWP